MIHLGDITKINGAEIEPVDCITARWASEIEEFPIAVTQYWFEEGNEKWR